MVLVVEKAALVWVFNFHPQKSFADYRVGTPLAGRCVAARVPTVGNRLCADRALTPGPAAARPRAGTASCSPAT